ncbi:hypothetical protein [Nitrosomonas communis]|uniref:Transposase IS200-like domain-containing protein n=1 Tax=Nitrosomonas communis TaxID=44574 RepID=A0A1I4Q2R5_9PROT|nr:hypothetical protein [Nitrosomonas communis]SFM34349.1 hypothetical protein SAMN05421863_102446 [Nitrosomonas communis]
MKAKPRKPNEVVELTRCHVADIDRERFLEIFRQIIEDFNSVCHVYCLMTNHYHSVAKPSGTVTAQILE